MARTTSIPSTTLPNTTCFAIQPRCLSGGDKELGAIRPGTGVGHAQQTGIGMLELKILVGKFGAVDGLSPGAVAVGKVSALAHEVGNDAVKTSNPCSAGVLPDWPLPFSPVHKRPKNFLRFQGLRQSGVQKRSVRLHHLRL